MVRGFCGAVLITVLAGLLAACDPTEPRWHEADAIPDRLADWGLVFRDGDRLRWSDASLVYDLTTPLFTDYAHKLRTLHVPESARIREADSGRLSYPVGTVFTKTFYYPAGDEEARVRKTAFDPAEQSDGLALERHRLIETRLLVHYDSGWKALVYVWDPDQSRARRAVAGALVPLQLVDPDGDSTDFVYSVPDANQCLGCHATAFDTRQPMPIGPARPDFINRASPLTDGNQLVAWRERGWLDSVPEHWPRAADWRDPAVPVATRARSYLEINCAHCHSETGAADTSGLWLRRDVSAGPRLGLCKPPVAAGQGTGGKRFGIVPGEPDQSILVHRLASRDPGAMMPELGRDLVHREGLALVRDWIAGLDGDCAAFGRQAMSRLD